MLSGCQQGRMVLNAPWPGETS